MQIFLRILIFSGIIIWGLYFFAPWLFNIHNFEPKNNKIDIKEYIITPDIWKVYLLNLKLLSLKDFEFNTLEAGTELYFNAIDIFNVNIINLLDDNNSNRKLVLNTYIKQLEHIQTLLSDTINNIQNNAIEEQTKSEEYLQQKQIWDTNFSEGFNIKDKKLVIEWVKQSYENGPKYIKHRILSNAWKILLSKLEKIKILIDAKLILLQNNADTIVNNFDLIKWELLWKLIELKKRLELNRYN